MTRFVSTASTTPPQRTGETTITPDQFEQVLSLVTDDQFRDYLRFVWDTGCRPQEVRLVEASHLDGEDRRMAKPKLLEQVRQAIQVRHMSPKTSTRIYRLDSPLHSLSQQAASKRDERA